MRQGFCPVSVIKIAVFLLKGSIANIFSGILLSALFRVLLFHHLACLDGAVLHTLLLYHDASHIATYALTGNVVVLDGEG